MVVSPNHCTLAPVHSAEPVTILDFKFNGHRITLSALANMFGGHRQSDLFGGFEIDDQFEFRRLLHRNFNRFSAF